MEKILHIETATHTCSVAISDGEEILAYKESHIDKSHASLLTVFIEDLFKETAVAAGDLDAIAVSMGPGSYTGLRIGVSVAKGLAYSLDIPVITVPTLKSMANGFLRRGEAGMASDAILCPMIDARRMEAYISLFDGALKTIKETEAFIIDENSFGAELDKQPVYFFGSGAAKCKGVVEHKNAFIIEDFQNSAVDMVAPAFGLFKQKDFADTAYFEPYYLKDFVATIPKNKVLGGL